MGFIILFAPKWLLKCWLLFLIGLFFLDESAGIFSPSGMLLLNFDKVLKVHRKWKWVCLSTWVADIAFVVESFGKVHCVMWAEFEFVCGELLELDCGQGKWLKFFCVTGFDFLNFYGLCLLDLVIELLSFIWLCLKVTIIPGKRYFFVWRPKIFEYCVVCWCFKSVCLCVCVI